jgi:hypothetical protein
LQTIIWGQTPVDNIDGKCEFYGRGGAKVIHRGLTPR